MPPRKRRENSGNYISEWFGFRIHPKVTPVENLVGQILSQKCPFISSIVDEDVICIKKERGFVEQVAEIVEGEEPAPTKKGRSTGVCTINSLSEGVRKDWVACPYRILDINIIEECARHLFAIEISNNVFIVPAPLLVSDAVKQQIADELLKEHTVIVFFEHRMGGEISLPSTDSSPELSFDLTLVEIVNDQGYFDVNRYAIVELQTADFHGSPGHAVSDLRKAADLFSESDEEFAEELEKHPEWLSNKIEGPNISNIFKRTFYQMMFKFQLVQATDCVGCVLMIPASVWDSWQRHLGKPEMVELSKGFQLLSKENIDASKADTSKSAWIYVIDIDSESQDSPNPLSVQKRIATDSISFSYYALEKASEAAVNSASTRLIPSIRSRINKLWPDFGASQKPLL